MHRLWIRLAAAFAASGAFNLSVLIALKELHGSHTAGLLNAFMSLGSVIIVISLAIVKRTAPVVSRFVPAALPLLLMPGLNTGYGPQSTIWIVTIGTLTQAWLLITVGVTLSESASQSTERGFLRSRGLGSLGYGLGTLLAECSMDLGFALTSMLAIVISLRKTPTAVTKMDQVHQRSKKELKKFVVTFWPLIVIYVVLTASTSRVWDVYGTVYLLENRAGMVGLFTLLVVAVEALYLNILPTRRWWALSTLFATVFAWCIVYMLLGGSAEMSPWKMTSIVLLIALNCPGQSAFGVFVERSKMSGGYGPLQTQTMLQLAGTLGMAFGFLLIWSPIFKSAEHEWNSIWKYGLVMSFVGGVSIAVLVAFYCLRSWPKCPAEKRALVSQSVEQCLEVYFDEPARSAAYSEIVAFETASPLYIDLIRKEIAHRRLSDDEVKLIWAIIRGNVWRAK